MSVELSARRLLGFTQRRERTGLPLKITHWRCVTFAVIALACLILAGCNRGGSSSDSDANTVVVYTSVDEPYAAPIIRDFEKRTGMKVDLRTDSEATKSVGLAERLRAEKDKP